MRLIERHTAILKEVARTGSVAVTELAKTLGVSGETIRRDIKALSEDGLLRRVHGGAAMPNPFEEPSFRQRLGENPEAKKAIARLAAEQVQDGDSLMLDTGSTTAYVARALLNHRDLLVVTNSVDIARTLATRRGNRVYMAGGKLRADDGASLGQSASEFVEQFRVRLSIISIGAIDVGDGLMDFYLDEAELSRAIIDRAERTIVVADHSKFGRRGVVKVCGWERIASLITERPPPQDFIKKLKKAGTEILVAN